MDQLQKLEERLRKEGLPHAMYEEIYGEVVLHVLSYPHSRNPIISFIFGNAVHPISIHFGPLPEHLVNLMCECRNCKDIHQAYDLIIAIHRALDS